MSIPGHQPELRSKDSDSTFAGYPEQMLRISVVTTDALAEKIIIEMLDFLISGKQHQSTEQKLDVGPLFARLEGGGVLDFVPYRDDREDIDALIDQQLARLEREYQRLAQQVASPAVVPAGRGSGVVTDEDAVAEAPDTQPTPGAEAVSPESGMAVASGSSLGTNRYALQLIGFFSREVKVLGSYPAHPWRIAHEGR